MTTFESLSTCSQNQTTGVYPAGGPRPTFTTWLADAISLLAPVGCAGCGRADVALCTECRAQLAPRVRTVDLGLLSVWAALDYGGAVSSVLNAAKEHGRTDVVAHLAPPLGLAVRTALAAVPPDAGWSAPLLVTMPSASAARRRRGYRPVDALVRRAGFAAPRRALLVLGREVADQAGLSARRRHLNLRQAMSASAVVAGRRVLLVDDVVTTGSTLLEAARAVSEAGGSVIGAACLAHTVKRKTICR